MSEAFGLPLDWHDSEGNKVFPLAALVILKAIDNEGDEIFAVVPTEGLSPIDALGMSHLAVLHSESKIRESIDYENS